MKMNCKVFVSLALAAAILSGCQKESSSPPLESENTNKENLLLGEANEDSAKESNDDSNNGKDKPSQKPLAKLPAKASKKSLENLPAVEGAKIGSVSSYVEDREVWNEFVDDEYIDMAKRYDFGIHVPRILLDTKDGDQANKEIDDLVDSLKDVYDRNKENIGDFDIGVYSHFSVYQDENILSVMIESSNIWEGELIHYKVFNFSIPDGNFIDDDDLMANLGANQNEILEVIENSFKENQYLITKMYYSDVMDASYIYDPGNYTGLVLNDLWDNYNPKKRQIYVDEMGNPNFLFDQYDIVDRGIIPANLKLRSNIFDTNPISNDYLRMARKLGIDPNDDQYKAFIIYMGSSLNEETMKEATEKLYAWTSCFTNYEDPPMILAIKDSQEGNRPYLMGEECYLVIPRYKNATISLRELEVSDDGSLEEVDNSYLDSVATSGTSFICQNMSDIAPNAKIILRYRDDVYEFSPSISMKDGSLILPDELINGEDALDWEALVTEDSYSYVMFQRILSILGRG